MKSLELKKFAYLEDGLFNDWQLVLNQSFHTIPRKKILIPENSWG